VIFSLFFLHIASDRAEEVKNELKEELMKMDPKRLENLSVQDMVQKSDASLENKIHESIDYEVEELIDEAEIDLEATLEDELENTDQNSENNDQKAGNSKSRKSKTMPVSSFSENLAREFHFLFVARKRVFG